MGLISFKKSSKFVRACTITGTVLFFLFLQACVIFSLSTAGFIADGCYVLDHPFLILSIVAEFFVALFLFKILRRTLKDYKKTNNE